MIAIIFQIDKSRKSFIVATGGGQTQLLPGPGLPRFPVDDVKEQSNTEKAQFNC
jgi:hypothetical protein